eukprot:6595937-Prymnesium_polylepis.1
MSRSRAASGFRHTAPWRRRQARALHCRRRSTAVARAAAPAAWPPPRAPHDRSEAALAVGVDRLPADIGKVGAVL